MRVQSFNVLKLQCRTVSGVTTAGKVHRSFATLRMTVLEPCNVLTWNFLALYRQQERLLKGFRDPAQETGCVRTVDEAVIVGQRERQNQPRLELAVDPFGFHARPRQPENRDFGIIHDRSKSNATDAAQVRNRERAAFHVGGSELFVAGFLGELRQFDRQLDDVLLIDVADYRNEKPAVCISGDPDVDVLLVDDFFFLNINTGVELRKHFQRRSADLECDGSNGHFTAGLFGLRGEAGTQLLEFSDICTIVLGDVWNCVPSFGEMLGSLATDAAHRDVLDLSPLAEIGELRLREVSGTRRGLCRGYCRRESRLGVSLDVVLADASTGTRTLHLVDVDTDLARQTPDVGRSRDGLAVFG